MNILVKFQPDISIILTITGGKLTSYGPKTGVWPGENQFKMMPSTSDPQTLVGQLLVN
jgi:hypothetical protein